MALLESTIGVLLILISDEGISLEGGEDAGRRTCSGMLSFLLYLAVPSLPIILLLGEFSLLRSSLSFDRAGNGILGIFLFIWRIQIQ